MAATYWAKRIDCAVKLEASLFSNAMKASNPANSSFFYYISSIQPTITALSKVKDATSCACLTHWKCPLKWTTEKTEAHILFHWREAWIHFLQFSFKSSSPEAAAMADFRNDSCCTVVMMQFILLNTNTMLSPDKHPAHTDTHTKELIHTTNRLQKSIINRALCCTLNTHTLTQTHKHTHTDISACCLLSLWAQSCCWLLFMSTFPVCNLNENVKLKACLEPTDLKLAKWQTESEAGEHNDTETWDKPTLLRRISEC